MKRDMKILMVIPRYSLTNDINYKYMFPLGLGYISAAMRRAGYQVDCLNLNHHKGYIRDIINKSLSEKKYDIACTGGNALMYNTIETIINAVREHSSGPRVIIGGPVITSEPKVVFEALNPDVGVIGEGDETITDILACLEEDGDIRKIKGIVYRDKDGGTAFTQSREPVKDIDTLPMPDYDGFGFEEQLENMHTNDYYFYHEFDFPRFYLLLGSRGCPYKCTFCYHYSSYRARSIDNIMEEVDLMVKRHKINIIYLIDECFSIKEERLYEFCSRIKKYREELGWDLKWLCQLTVSSVDRKLLETMKDAGCFLISYGFESYSHAVLKSMHKPATPAKIDFALHETLKVGMGVQGSFIFGDVAETAETARETLDYWKNSCKGQVSLGFIQPYPGSEIYEHCLRKGIIKDKLSFLKNELSYGHVRNMTDRMTDEEINQLKRDIYDAISKYCEFVRPLSLKKIIKNVYDVKAQCPYCKDIRTYKSCHIDNRATYDFFMTCRNCHMRFYIVSMLRKIAYSNYAKLKDIGIFYYKIRDRIRKKRM